MAGQSIDVDTVVIAGGGPVGMVTATVLAYYGVKSIIFERNLTTTKWPKMDLTNVRSMELFRKLRLADSLREQGVPLDIPYNVIFSTGLGYNEPVTKWDHVSVDEYRQLIRSKNDGTQPLEPYQRISQSIFEAWMKDICDKNPLIDLRFGWKLESVEETKTSEAVETHVTDLNTNTRHVFKSKYMIGCDGASSKTRRSLEIPLDGGPLPAVFLLVHFKSHDLARLHKHGRFWHLMILEEGKFGGAVISQDEKDTFTIHLALEPEVDVSTITSEEAVYRVLGGQKGQYHITIDEILVRSTYRPSIAVARKFSGANLRIFLAGDAAHQNIPTGGYGMNTGLGDAFDIGWKLAAVLNGHGKRGLLQSYEEERRPVSLTNVERSGVHMATHIAAVKMLSEEGGLPQLHPDSKLRNAIHDHYQKNNGENTDLGVEMGYRYSSSICIPDEEGTAPAPAWSPHVYLPTTVPGGRPPHVFLEKDESSIFDHFGKDYTLVEFADPSQPDLGSALLLQAAETIGVPLIHFKLVNEDHAADLWEYPLVLVRPDQHVAWRGRSIHCPMKAESILKTIIGDENELATRSKFQQRINSSPGVEEHPISFTSTEGKFTQTSKYVLENMGEFQK